MSYPRYGFAGVGARRVSRRRRGLGDLRPGGMTYQPSAAELACAQQAATDNGYGTVGVPWRVETDGSGVFQVPVSSGGLPGYTEGHYIQFGFGRGYFSNFPMPPGSGTRSAELTAILGVPGTVDTAWTATAALPPEQRAEAYNTGVVAAAAKKASDIAGGVVQMAPGVERAVPVVPGIQPVLLPEVERVVTAPVEVGASLVSIPSDAAAAPLTVSDAAGFLGQTVPIGGKAIPVWLLLVGGYFVLRML